MIADLAAESRADSNGGADSGADDFLAVLMKTDPAEQSAVMEKHLQALTARVLRMDAEKVDISAPLSALGLDSMMAMELKNRLDLSLGMAVPMLDLLKGASIAELSPDLLSRLIAEDSEIQQVLAELEPATEPR
jgi:acyl carrier protein